PPSARTTTDSGPLSAGFWMAPLTMLGFRNESSVPYISYRAAGLASGPGTWSYLAANRRGPSSTERSCRVFSDFWCFSACSAGWLTVPCSRSLLSSNTSHVISSLLFTPTNFLRITDAGTHGDEPPARGIRRSADRTVSRHAGRRARRQREHTRRVSQRSRGPVRPPACIAQHDRERDHR